MWMEKTTFGQNVLNFRAFSLKISKRVGIPFGSLMQTTTLKSPWRNTNFTSIGCNVQDKDATRERIVCVVVILATGAKVWS